VVLHHLSKFPFIILPYIEEEQFHCLGVPEVVLSNNGVQLKSHAFNVFLQKYGAQHAYTAVYSPESKASAKVNRFILAAIKAYIHHDQSTWDVQLSSIACAIVIAIVHT